MYQINPMSREPVYEQIINQTERFILTGVLSAGDRMPSVRNLSVELSVNPNTIQKAFSELDRRGLIFSVPGRGSFVSEKAREALLVSRRDNIPQIRKKLNELKLAGIRKEEVIEIVNEVYDGEDRRK
ncbi:MAG: GntR family transcriptional regulator [Butyrivibrio sp.]